MDEETRCLLAMPRETCDAFFTEAILEGIRSRAQLRSMAEAGIGPREYAKMLDTFNPHVVITGWGSPKLPADALSRAPALALLVHTAGGIRGVIGKSLMEAGVRVTNWGSTGTRSVAEGALFMILASLRRATLYDHLMQVEKNWGPVPALTEGLFYRRVGIHGFGHVARALAEFLRPFECEIRTYDPPVPDSLLERSSVTRADSLRGLFAENQILVELAAQTEENRRIVNRDILAAMPDGAHFILTGRASVVETPALIEELQSGRIFAAIDVFDEEPLPADSPLRGLRNCFLTPHIAGPTPDRRYDMGNLAARNVGHFVAGEPLEHEIHPERYDMMT